MAQGIAGSPRVFGGRSGHRLTCRAKLLADIAAATGLIEFFDEAAAGRRVRRSAHRPGRVLADVAVMLAR